jgi:site-specific recombinase XerC
MAVIGSMKEGRMEQGISKRGGFDVAIREGDLWEDVVDAFLDANVDSGNTRQAYRRHLRAAFGSFRVRTVAEVTGAMLVGYRARLMDDGRGDACHAQAVSALRSFLRWSRAFGAHGLRSEVIEAALKMPRARIRRPYQTIGKGDGRRLLKAARTARDQSIVGLLLGAGLRVAEVSALDVGDVIDIVGGPAVYVRWGKGRQDRTVPLGRDVGLLVTTTSRRRIGPEVPEPSPRRARAARSSNWPGG